MANKKPLKNEDILEALQEIGLTTWKTKKQILQELRAYGIKLHDREWYYFVERHNLKYCDGVEELFIAHSKQRGYIFTTDYELIKASWEDFEKVAKNLLWKASRYKKAYAQSLNLSFVEKVEILE